MKNINKVRLTKSQYWFRFGAEQADKPLSEPMMAQFTDAYLRLPR